jgi:hypothetical protein
MVGACESSVCSLCGEENTMQKTLAFALCAAVGAAASAHPFGEKWSTPIPGPVGGAVEAIELDEGFEAYGVGAGVTSMGGWELWPAGLDAVVTDALASSGTKSGNWSTTAIDVVHQFSGITSGTVTFSSDIFIPSSADVTYYMIALNQYDGGGVGTNWSVQVQFDSLLATVTAQLLGGLTFSTPLVYDQWVEFRVEIDLDADQVDYFYNGIEFASDISWIDGVSGGGIPTFAAIDLYTDLSTTGDDVYLDNVVIETGAATGCYADCDESGTLDFFDFLCFQDAFAAGASYADCDESGTLDFFDFLCFQDAFAAGCP